MTTTYSIIEHAGSVDERVFTDFGTIEDARGWMRDAYDPEEIETLNVRIASEVDGDRIYERAESGIATRVGGCRRARKGSAGRSSPEQSIGDHCPKAWKPSSPAPHRRILQRPLNSGPGDGRATTAHAQL